MSRRTNPWPALVDLFSALFVAAFAGFILIASELKGSGDVMRRIRNERDRLEIEVNKIRAGEGQITQLRAEADRIVNNIEDVLAQDQHLRSKVFRCGDDACLDLFIHYDSSRATIPPDQRMQVLALGEACRTLRAALDRLPSEQRHDIEVTVEGHADRTQTQIQDAQQAYLYNWSLSSQRAASVLYEFQRCGLAPPDYSISVIGYADSERVCQEQTEACDRQNRRTTLRLRANSHRIAERLGTVLASRPDQSTRP